MRYPVSSSMMSVAVAASAVSAVVMVSISEPMAQAPTLKTASATTALQTPWGEPDLQGIWTDESDTPMQRSPRFANQEFFTDAQRAELDRARSALIGRDRRAERGTEPARASAPARPVVRSNAVESAGDSGAFFLAPAAREKTILTAL